MSHFVVTVLVDKKNLPTSRLKKEVIEKEVSKLMIPFDENAEVDEYEKDCWCIGTDAKIAARKAADETVATIDQLRRDFFEAHPLPEGKTGFYDLPEDEEEARDILWQEHLRFRREVEEWFTQGHDLFEKPDPGCEECKGTGKIMSTYNPDSKWDWWVIGGRWTGLFGNYDPSTDRKNYEWCKICDGTGMRMDMIGIESRAVDPNYMCNSCHGNKIVMKWMARSNPKGDWMWVKNVIWEDNLIPYAIVTPDGEWHQKGEMGWFGISKDKMKSAEWREKARTIFSENQDTLAVIVDCHI